MSLLACLSRWPFCRVRGPARGVGILLLLPVLGSGAKEEESRIPRLIIGGKQAFVADYPFVLYLFKPDHGGCTGSLIAPSWVLTAAHCLVDQNGNVHNRVGFYHSRGEKFYWNPRTSKRIILHPRYRDNLTYYDIGLVELSRPYPASFSAGLDLPRRSAEEEYAPSGTSAVTVGFGRIRDSGGSTLHPNFITENLYHAKDCRDRQNIFEEFRIDNNSICSGTATKRVSFGDSGGPLIVSYSVGGNKRWLQVGVSNRVAISAASPSLNDYIGGIFARVSSYADWIHSTTQGAAPLVAAPDPEEDDADEITRRLSEVNAQISSLQATAQSLQRNRTLLKQHIDDFKGVEGQDKKLQTTEDGILSSVSTVLAQ